MDLGLKGKRALITGATGGIGRAIADLLLEEGASVSICARREEPLKEALSCWHAKGYTAFGAVCDVSDKDAYDAWLASATAQLGGVDIFIPNVSGGAQAGEEGWKTAFETDLLATVRGCEALAPALSESNGSIVVIASIAGLEAFGGPSAYNTIKAGLITYASQYGEVSAQLGIRINCVSPGPIYIENGFWGTVKATQPEMYKAIEERHPMGRMGLPEEVAKAVVFLASPAASWVTRTNLIIDGGFTRRVQF